LPDYDKTKSEEVIQDIAVAKVGLKPLITPMICKNQRLKNLMISFFLILENPG
jgi:hypothetical protein